MSKPLFYIFILVSFCIDTIAQPKLTLPNYRQYTLRDGLSQMQVTCMIQDSRGYIWIGTKEGLNCFNGEKFQKYTRNDGLANDYIYQLIEDKTGKIWISTGKGLACYDGGKIETFESNIINPGIAIDNEDKVWYYGRDEKYNGYFGYLENGKYISKFDDFKPDEKVFQIGFLFFVPNENRFFFHHVDKWYTYHDGIFKPVGEPLLSLSYQSSSGRFYLVGETTDGWIVNEVVNGKPEQKAVVKDNKYIFSTLTETITINNFIRSIVYELRPDTFIANENPEIMPTAILTDKDGTQWVGGEEGIYKMLGDGFTTYSRQYLPTVWGITEDLQGTMWFASFNLGLRKLADDKLTTISLPDHEMGYNLYFHPSVDKRGRIFFTNYNGTVVVDGNRIYQEKDKSSISSFYDREKDVLFIGDHDTAKVFTPDFKLIKKLSINEGFQVGANVLAIQKNNEGYYWFAGGRGIARYDWNSGEVTLYNIENGRFKGGGAVVIRNDYRGRTWFGTKQGLYWYDSKEDSLKKLEVEEISGSVNLIEPIDSTWLIVSQLHGIYLMNLQKYYKNGEVELQLFNEKNGFQGIEPGQDGAFTDSKGNVWMTTSTEVVKLNPAELKIGKYSLKVRIDKCNNKKIPFSSGSIHLPHNHHSAVITFDAICFNRPNPVEYSWKLDRDSVWSSWQVEDYAVLSDLPDGENTFQVKARIKGLPLDVLPLAEIKAVVDIAFYRQPWFFPTLFLIISLIGILLLFLAVLKTKQAAREAKVFQVQAIQSQMNPHFIFNVLASLQSMILKSNIAKANDYLVKLADLIRGFLEASAGTGILKSPKTSEGQVPLKSELKILSDFVDFQQVINPGRFDFEISIDPAIDTLEELIPPMLVQPFVENAIRHGILPSEKKGLLKLDFSKTEKGLIIEISDNGIGMEKAGKMLEKSPMSYTSRGRELTMKRIDLLNQLGFSIDIETVSNDNGTRIKLTINK